jgi:hypothetical protein
LESRPTGESQRMSSSQGVARAAETTVAMGLPLGQGAANRAWPWVALAMGALAGALLVTLALVLTRGWRQSRSAPVPRIVVDADPAAGRPPANGPHDAE